MSLTVIVVRACIGTVIVVVGVGSSSKTRFIRVVRLTAGEILRVGMVSSRW